MFLNRKNIFAFILIIVIMIIGCDEKEVFTESPELDLPPMGSILIESDPANARIFLNGKNMGINTPATLKFLTEGEYKITLKLDLFLDTTVIIPIYSLKETKLKINYKGNFKNYGSIMVKAWQNALIILNDSVTNFRAPYHIMNLLPGYYKVKATLAEHRPDSTIVVVRANKSSEANLNLEDTSKSVSYNIYNSEIGADVVKCIKVDNDNNVWIASSFLGPIRYNNSKFEVYAKQNPAMFAKRIVDIQIDKSNNVWFGTDRGLLKYQNGIWTDYSNFISGYVTGIAVDNNGIVWIGTDKGLIRFDGSSSKIYNSNTVSLSLFPTNSIVDVSVEQNTGKVWFAMGFNNGIHSFDGTNWEAINITDMKVDPKIGNYCNYINIDNNGVIWVSYVPNSTIGTTGGLVYFDGTNWNKATIPGFNSDYIINISNYGKINFIFQYSEVAMFTNILEDIRIFNKSNVKISSNSRFSDATFDKAGNLWFATYNGVIKVKKGFF